MSVLHTDQETWRVMNQATVNVQAGITANVNTYALAYGETWGTLLSTSGGACAQNPANRPSIAAGPFPFSYNAVRVRFLVADTADDVGSCTIWGWDSNGAPRDLLVINPIQAGTSVCEVLSPNNDSLIHLAFTTGATEIYVGDTIVGETGAATAWVEKVVVTSGSWRAGDAAGVLFLTSVSGTFEAENLSTRNNPRYLHFQSGGTAEVVPGDIVVGATTGATAKVLEVTITQYTWASGNAIGILHVQPLTGNFYWGTTTGENLNVTGKQSNIATLRNERTVAAIGGDVTKFYYADVATVTTDNCNVVEPGVTADGIRELSFDLKGISYLFSDYDINAATGTACTDIITLYKGF